MLAITKMPFALGFRVRMAAEDGMLASSGLPADIVWLLAAYGKRATSSSIRFGENGLIAMMWQSAG